LDFLSPASILLFNIFSEKENYRLIDIERRKSGN